ncbi:MAG: multidrug ABC transporter ATPase [Salinibacterium sp.]|nr:multidrug ABC transporter ATPase [Salinibacterium sp.]
MPKDAPISSQRPERILAFMAAAAVGLSIICFLAVIIATGTGVGQDAFSAPPWPTIIVLPVIGLPLGAIFLIALIVISSIRRGREAKDDRK